MVQLLETLYLSLTQWNTCLQPIGSVESVGSECSWLRKDLGNGVTLSVSEIMAGGDRLPLYIYFMSHEAVCTMALRDGTSCFSVELAFAVAEV